jgi:hypothetical protein
MLHIHVEKGQIRYHIPVSETIIEFNAVNDLNASKKVDMIGSQVTMTIANSACFNTPLEEALPAFKESATNLANELPSFQVQETSCKRLQLPKVFFHVESNHISLTVVINLRTLIAPFIKGSQYLSQLFHMSVADLVLFEEFLKTQAIRQLSHLDGIFYDWALVFQGEPMIIGFVDLDHFLVDIPAKSLIQANLLFTKMVSVFQVAKIEETEIYRFFELIHPGAGEKNSGNMGVPAFEVRNRMRIKGGIGQCLT